MAFRDQDLRWVWWGALGCFGLAGATGALYRFGLLSGFPFGLQLTDVRHAHSHLMYFGWVTPALMALIAQRLPALTARAVGGGFRRVIGLTLFLALLAYPPFLFFGYRAAELGERRLPLSVIASSMNILAWYAFGWLYLHSTRRAPRNLALRLWDAALIFQALASLGAWGRAVLAAFKIQDPFWELALVHLFLDLFSDGWFVLALLGLLYGASPGVVSQRGNRLLFAGLPATFLLGVPPSQTPAGLRWIAGAGGVLAALGLMAHLRALWPHVQRRAWRAPVFFLGLKAVALVGISLPPAARWAEQAGLRISYLHWSLLGFVSLGLVAAAQDAWGAEIVRGWRWLTVAVLVVLATLIPFTQLWPFAWSGRWTLRLAAWVTLGPIITALGMLFAGLRHRPSGA